MPNFDRYSRQLLVSQIGEDGQKQLSQAKVLIVGMGGLGCQIGAQLAGAGIGTLSLVDHDVIDVSNLHRQILFRESDIGLTKAEVAERELTSINSNIAIKAIQARINPDNILGLLKNTNLVIDAADNFATSYLLSDACSDKQIPLISASVNRSFGYVGLFCGTKNRPAPSFRALFPSLPKEQISCDIVGVTGPSVGIIANIQAQEAIKVLLNDEQQLLGKLLYVDCWNYKMHTVDFSSAKESKDAQINLLSQLQITKHDFVVDVRNADEIKTKPQLFSTHLDIPLSDFKNRINELPSSGRVILACLSGQRALIAAQILLEHDTDNSIAVVITNSYP